MMSGWKWRHQELERFPCNLAICKVAGGYIEGTLQCFIWHPLLVPYTWSSTKMLVKRKSGLKGLLVNGYKKGLVCSD